MTAVYPPRRPSGWTPRRSAWLCWLSLLALLSCVRTSPIRDLPSVESECEAFFERLDGITENAGLTDGGTSRIAGARYLRASRFLASFTAADLAGPRYTDWLDRLRALDAERREAEITNLQIDGVGVGPRSPFPALTTREAVGECGRRLVERDARSGQRKSWLLEHAMVPDSYRGWQRVVGLYPLARLAFDTGIAALHRRFRESFALPPNELPRDGRLTRYAPPVQTRPNSDLRPDLFRRSSMTPLGVPGPDSSTMDLLYDAFAPVWEVDTAGAGDRIGAVRRDWNNRPWIDVHTPVVYRFHSYTRYRNDTLLQLNYLIWFPERASSGRLDLYAGRLDGILWRVTLSPDAQPVAYDAIHPCGCYYLIFPGLGYRVVQPRSGDEAVLSPYPLPPPKQGQRLVIRISSGEHSIQAVYADRALPDETPYRWRRFSQLGSLAGTDGRRRSLFGPDGLIAGTERLERFFLWPSGIVSPGAMRQPGVQAIALVGRRHFDDARLLDELLRPL